MPTPAPCVDETGRSGGSAPGLLAAGERSPELDALAELASGIFAAPIAAIATVGQDQQWSKADAGFDVAELSRKNAFWDHSIQHPETTLCVPDAANDARFATDRLVTGPFGLRFYAAAPIAGPGGEMLGAVCVADQAPRKCDARQLALLQQVALAAGCAFELHAAQRELRERADRDPLTGLLNRAAFTQRLATALGVAGCKAGLLSLDLDGFNVVNSMFGHAGGDAALCELADRLLRVSGPASLVCRYGGDQFWVLADGISGPQDLYRLCAQFHEAIIAPFAIERQAVALRVSIGVAIFPDHAQSCDGLIQKMDAALWEAKRSGGGCTRFAAGARAPAPAGRNEMRTMLRDALFPPGREPFALVLQPIFAGATQCLRGFEALVRWPDGNGGALHPADFIPQAESTGLIVELDRWMLDQACQIAAGWPTPLKISSNLSATNFFAGDLVQEVRAILDRSGLPPERLELEITETVLLGDHDRVRDIISAFHAMGIGVVLDDFGAGYASIAYLRTYDFDAVKIDRSFVANLETDPSSRAFVRAIIEMARALDLDTVAEGVETDGQLVLLQEDGVSAIQGYLLGRPMCPQSAQKLIEASVLTA